MKYRLIITLLLLVFALPVLAEQLPEVTSLSTEWAKHKYQTPKKDRKKAFEQLSKKAAEVSKKYPGKAEPLIWEAIIVASAAGEQGGIGISALGMVKKAKALLEQAEQIDPEALDGSVYTSLGSLYYSVPGWPVGFGNNDKARDYLEKALTVNPDGIDPNYFYGDFLMSQRDYKGAVQAFTVALNAPARPDQQIADTGRRIEIRQALAKAKEQLQSDASQTESYAHPFSGR